jgi:hypothetical protein
MTVGALLYAFDGEICYTKFAVACAQRIKLYLDIPVSLVTDSQTNDPVFDQVIKVDSQASRNRRWWADTETSTTWKNFGRSTAFDLSPYDRTLLIDVDYVVNSDNITQLLDNKNSFFAHNTVCSVHLPTVRQQKFGIKNTDMWWATLVVFDRSDFSKDIFSVWKMVENHYRYYADFFGFESQQFRNDHALSIALLVANGGTMPNNCNIPWPLMNADPGVAVVRNLDEYKILYSVMEQGQKKYRRISTKDQDLHVMGKSYLEQIYAL